MPDEPLFEGLQTVFFYVRDMERALGFYHGLLGLPLLERGESWSALDCGGVRLGLHLVHGGVAAGGSSPVVSFRVADARAAADRLRAAGVPVGEVADEPFGLLVQLEDPDRHALRLVQPRA